MPSATPAPAAVKVVRDVPRARWWAWKRHEKMARHRAHGKDPLEARTRARRQTQEGESAMEMAKRARR